MFGSLHKLWARQRNERFVPPAAEKPAALQPNPQMLQIAESNANEEKVLELIERAGHDIDRETGMIAYNDGEFQHWSLCPAYRKLARGVRFKTTTGWPDRMTMALQHSALSTDGAELMLGIPAGGALRFYVNTQFRKRLLDDEAMLVSEEFFVQAVLPFFPMVERVPSEILGIITGAMVLKFADEYYWNPSHIPPCRDLLTEGFFDFEFFDKERTT